jgi:general secretion pathway protein N
VFLETSTRNVVRLRVGEDHQGWVLRSVKSREATLEKDTDTAVLELPPPGGGEPQMMVNSAVPNNLPPPRGRQQQRR